MHTPLKVVFSLVLACLFSISAAQDIGDLSKINVDDLSDTQIESYLQKAQSSGLTQTQMELLARQRGMTSSQISKLRQRILEVQTGGKNEGGVLQTKEDRLRESYAQKEPSFFEDLISYDSLESNEMPVFGQEIFSSAFTFEPSANVATPENYVLGAGDEIIIDIYGASEISYQKTITPDGKVFISGVGPIHLAGISVRAAKNRIFNKLSSIYSGLNGYKPNTFMEVTIGSIKTITVNVVGNVKKPGTYALSSFSTAFNAFYAAGGPNEIGSMRKIEVMRAGNKIATLDVYKYFYEGDLSGNPSLQDGDALVVKPYQNRVVYAGEVKQPAIYEFTDGETFDNLLAISGGALPSGYQQKVTLYRNNDYAKSLLTFDKGDFGSVKIQSGDSIYIPPINDEYTNRVRIEGAVKQPGFYELTDQLTLLDLLNQAQVGRDAYLARGNIVRLNADLSLSNIAFNPDKVLGGTENYLLQNEDVISIASLLDIKERETVRLLGEVKNPGEFPFVEGLTAEDLITIAGGLKPSANPRKIEVARRVSKDSEQFQTAIIFEYGIAEGLEMDAIASDFKLEPYDLVTIKASALFRPQKTIKIEGEVMNPGVYALESEDERLVSLIFRAGGLTAFSYPEGALLIRSSNPNRSEGINKETTETLDGYKFRNAQLSQLEERDSVSSLDIEIQDREVVGIRLAKALQNPNSLYNVILQDGDILSIPKQMNTVKVRGEVLYPTRVSYDPLGGFQAYISQAGGFSDRAQSKKAYVVYANGEAKRTRRFLFFKFYPKIEPGCDIFIPQKPERRRLSTQEVIGITSSLATLALVIDRLLN